MKAALQKDNPRDKYACEKQSDKDFVKKNAGVKQTVLIEKICADRNNGKYYQIKVAYLGIEMIVSFHGVFVLSSYAIQNYCRIFDATIGFLFHKNIIATINQKEKTVFQAKSERVRGDFKFPPPYSPHTHHTQKQKKKAIRKT